MGGVWVPETPAGLAATTRGQQTHAGFASPAPVRNLTRVTQCTCSRNRKGRKGPCPHRTAPPPEPVTSGLLRAAPFPSAPQARASRVPAARSPCTAAAQRAGGSEARLPSVGLQTLAGVHSQGQHSEPTTPRRAEGGEEALPDCPAPPWDGVTAALGTHLTPAGSPTGPLGTPPSLPPPTPRLLPISPRPWTRRPGVARPELKWPLPSQWRPASASVAGRFGPAPRTPSYSLGAEAHASSPPAPPPAQCPLRAVRSPSGPATPLPDPRDLPPSHASALKS